MAHGLWQRRGPRPTSNCWPAARHGSVLVTSRTDLVSFDPASAGRQILLSFPQEDSEFLLKMLARGEYTEAEESSAQSLSDNLDGLPLALHLMGVQIRKRGKRIEQFLSYYQQNSRRLH